MASAMPVLGYLIVLVLVVILFAASSKGMLHKKEEVNITVAVFSGLVMFVMVGGGIMALGS